MVGIDFDFARYVAYRRGMVEQRARDGAAYSYAGERKVRRALMSARPVALAIEATSRLWRGRARDELLASSVKASDVDYPAVYRAGNRAATALALDPLAIFIAPPQSEIDARALGTDDDAVVILGRDLVERLSESELVAVVGHELAHVQNNHVLYTTALFYLRHEASFFMRWIVQPAIMALQAWSRRAEISCDRAALICARDLDTAISALIKLALPEADDASVASYLQDELPRSKGGVGRFAEYFRSEPYLPKRIEALRAFADSAFYKKLSGADPTGAPTADDVDVRVGEILSVFR